MTEQKIEHFLLTHANPKQLEQILHSVPLSILHERAKLKLDLNRLDVGEIEFISDASCLITLLSTSLHKEIADLRFFLKEFKIPFFETPPVRKGAKLRIMFVESALNRPSDERHANKYEQLMVDFYMNEEVTESILDGNKIIGIKTKNPTSAVGTGLVLAMGELVIPRLGQVAQITNGSLDGGDAPHIGGGLPGEHRAGAVHPGMAEPALGRGDQPGRDLDAMASGEVADDLRRLGFPGQRQAALGELLRIG